MKTFVKTFYGESGTEVSNLINNYAEKNKLEIISVSHAILYFDMVLTDTHYMTVVFKEVRE